MKKASKNEIDMKGILDQIQTQLIALEKKVDTLINRSLTPQAKPSTTSPADNNRGASMPNDRNKERVMYTAICADCKKECKIPFKPSGDRPVYCQDCFSRRKVISMSGMSVSSPQITINKVPEIQKPQAKKQKKAVPVKKTVGKKKSVPKKK